VKQTHSGSGDNITGNKTVNIYANFREFYDLEAKLKLLKENKEIILERTNKYPTDDSFKQELLQINKDELEVKNELENFKNEILRLTKTFQQVETNATERLKLAKQYFDNGQLTEAETILDAKELLSDQDKLLTQKDNLKEAFIKNRKKLVHNSNEFLVKAKLTAINFDDENRFETAKNTLKNH